MHTCMHSYAAGKPAVHSDGMVLATLHEIYGLVQEPSRFPLPDLELIINAGQSTRVCMHTGMHTCVHTGTHVYRHAHMHVSNCS